MLRTKHNFLSSLFSMIFGEGQFKAYSSSLVQLDVCAIWKEISHLVDHLCLLLPYIIEVAPRGLMYFFGFWLGS